MIPDDLTTFQLVAGSGLVLAFIAFVAGWLDRRNTRRRDLDRVSLVNWHQISALALMVAIVLLSIAAHLWFSA
ncbi:hypothetical protein OLX02_08670 [Novosphingobium sp. KCTC 2891]|uniref:hypothetical protein n=1 Tax=Novosphingobium sp. KCTC 2891 TaxID=2989730 RepID=UPI002222091C|nr:hypothetical protein [Novosphingobium sp. KCTC 2891]MCW1382895.1 hypothetical protein [Novosphingobium sp. KCTC 2891]